MTRARTEVLIAPDGSLRCIYSDDALPLLERLGVVEIARASFVEPVPAPGGRWYADMRPVLDGSRYGWRSPRDPCSGPQRFLVGFNTRAEALAAEVSWLREHGVPIPARS